LIHNLGQDEQLKIHYFSAEINLRPET